MSVADILQPVLKDRMSNKALLYYVDGSTSAENTGLDSFNNFSNAYDGNLLTYAQAIDVTLNVGANINGVNAPATGKTIKKVELYAKTNSNLFGPSSFSMTVNVPTAVGYDWTLFTEMTGYQTMPVPAGGWTWAHIQSIGFTLSASADDSGNMGGPRASQFSIYGGFIRVTTKGT